MGFTAVVSGGGYEHRRLQEGTGKTKPEKPPRQVEMFLLISAVKIHRLTVEENSPKRTRFKRRNSIPNEVTHSRVQINLNPSTGRTFVLSK